MPIWGDRYAGGAARYLVTERGRDTPEVVAKRMLALQPATVGLGAYPSLEELHLVRITLERIARGRGELGDEAEGEITQTRLRPLAARRNDAAPCAHLQRAG
jgi:hypothetical protein